MLDNICDETFQDFMLVYPPSPLHEVYLTEPECRDQREKLMQHHQQSEDRQHSNNACTPNFILLNRNIDFPIEGVNILDDDLDSDDFYLNQLQNQKEIILSLLGMMTVP